jgi:hypothetical protein
MAVPNQKILQRRSNTSGSVPTTSSLFVGEKLIISGTLTGTGTIIGYTDPKTYYIIVTNGGSTFTLSETLGGSAITTTAGTTLGLTFTPDVFTQGNTYTITTLGNINWTSIGAAVAIVGCVFVKNASVVTGTSGTATEEVVLPTASLIGNLQTPQQTTFLRDPYDIYTSIPHVPFNSVTGVSNTPQPADISNIAVSKIVIGSTSGALGCPTLDWTVEACGYSSVVAGVSKEFILKYN